MNDLVQRAGALAHTAHAGQTRKGAAAEPYVIHVAEVAALVAGFGGDAVAQAAAWLHDVVEDCDYSSDDIAAHFGADVAAVVAELTDDTTLARAARKAAQIAAAPGKSPRAALVKACDKISNIRALRLSPPLDWNGARRRAYLDWSAEVVAALPAGADAARPMFQAELALGRAAYPG